MRGSKPMETLHGRQGINRTTAYRNSAYVAGNTVRKIDTVRELQQPIKRQNETVRKNRERVKYMNLPYVLFLSCAMIVAGIMLIGYLQMQSEMTVSIKRIALLESQLNDLRLSNDEQLERINSAIDMDEIKRIAVEELGMTYAKEGQVISISGEGSDYVRQMVSLPD